MNNKTNTSLYISLFSFFISITLFVFFNDNNHKREPNKFTEIDSSYINFVLNNNDDFTFVGKIRHDYFFRDKNRNTFILNKKE